MGHLAFEGKRGFFLPMLKADGVGHRAVDVLEDGGFGLAAGFPRHAPDQLGLDGLEEGEERQEIVRWTVFPT